MSFEKNETKLSEVFLSKNRTVLPALKSNYLAFDIFSFLE